MRFNTSFRDVMTACSKSKRLGQAGTWISPEMINVNYQKCQHKDCNTSPSFNFPGEYKMIYCFEHKSPEMINVKQNKCHENKCKKSPVYGLDKKPTHCESHKTDKMKMDNGKAKIWPRT